VGTLLRDGHRAGTSWLNNAAGNQITNAIV
jgi:hypothetical protein